MVKAFLRLFGRIGPVGTSFGASLVLSFVATRGRLVNRDGIFYLDTARAIHEQGAAALITAGEWNFYPALIALLSKVSTIGLENSALTINAFLMAGACAGLVAWVRRVSPESAWMACWVVLATPAFNQYRGDILREFGFWFFSVTGLYQARLWNENWRNLKPAVASQLLLFGAMLFRFEAGVFFLALSLWQVVSAQRNEIVRRLLVINAVPLAATILFCLLLLFGVVNVPGRISYYMDAANQLAGFAQLQEAATRLLESVLITKYAREESIYVLIFGLLSLVPLKLVFGTGLLLVPLFYGIKTEGPVRALARWQPLPWAFAFYGLVLCVFVLHQFFISGRYVSALALMSVPVISCGLLGLVRGYGRARYVFYAVLLLYSISNVYSIKPARKYILEAGHWLSGEKVVLTRVCTNDSRAAYYAGWPSSAASEGLQAEMQLRDRVCDLVAFEFTSKTSESIAAALQKYGFSEVKRFPGDAGRGVVIAKSAHYKPLPDTVPAHELQAGYWLARQRYYLPAVCVGAPRVDYYAGWNKATVIPEFPDIAGLQAKCAILVLSHDGASRDAKAELLARGGYRMLKAFQSADGGGVVVAGRIATASRNAAAKFGRRHEISAGNWLATQPFDMSKVCLNNPDIARNAGIEMIAKGKADEGQPDSGRDCSIIVIDYESNVDYLAARSKLNNNGQYFLKNFPGEGGAGVMVVAKK